MISTSTVTSENITMSEAFWRFIKENVGISTIYPSTAGSKSISKNKKVKTLEERQKNIEYMLQKTENEDDKMQPGNQELLDW